MLAYIPYMDPMGYDIWDKNIMGEWNIMGEYI